jgi:hypothetical protein
MIAALLRRDSASGETWLSFPRAPPAPIRTQLKESGWLFNGALQSWRHRAPTPPLPSGVTIGEAPPEPLSSYRPLNGPEILAVLARARAVMRAQLEPAH